MAFPTGYVLAEAQLAINLSNAAYQCDANDYRDIRQGIIASLPEGFQLNWLATNGDMSTLCYVASCPGDTPTYAVVCRGTVWAFLADWVDDFDVLDTHGWPTASPADPAILVAQGSWDGLQAVLTMTSEDDGRNLSQVLTSIAGAGGIDLFITGHSLGGALATVLGLYLADTAGSWGADAVPIGLKTYTFAAPTTGNQSYADYYKGRSGLSTLTWQAFRVYNEQDVVPHAYADLEGVAESGIPLTFALQIAVSGAAALVDAMLDWFDVSYIPVDDGEPLGNVPPSKNPAPAPAIPPAPATTMGEFADWVGYEHSSLTYMALLGLSTAGRKDCSLDLDSIRSIGSGRLGDHLARASRVVDSTPQAAVGAADRADPVR